MNPQQYAKILAIATDERADPATRAIAQKQVEKWKDKMSVPLGRHRNPLHPGRVQTEEYKRWVKDMAAGNRELKR